MDSWHSSMKMKSKIPAGFFVIDHGKRFGIQIGAQRGVCSLARLRERVGERETGLPVGLHQLVRVDLLGSGIQFNPLEDGIQALDGADADLAIAGYEGIFQPLHGVKLGELAVIVERGVGHHFLLGLFAQVAGVDQEQDAFALGEFQQAIDGGDGSVGLACAGGHLDQRARAVGLERFFQIDDGGMLAVAQAFVRGERRNVVQPLAQRVALRQPFLERFRAVEVEYLARTRLGIAAIGEAGDDAGALVEERQRLFVVDPLELGGGITGGL